MLFLPLPAARKAGSMWYPAGQPHPRSLSLSGLLGRAARYESLPAPVDRRVRVLGWAGTLLLAGALAFLALAPGHLDPAGRHADFFLFGRGIFAAVLDAGGRAAVVLPVGWAALAAAMVLAILTSGFRRARSWQQVAILAVGLVGTVAVVPVAVALAVAAVNLVIWLAILGLALAAAREVIGMAFDG
jgi:hypothetical protein